MRMLAAESLPGRYSTCKQAGIGAAIVILIMTLFDVVAVSVVDCTHYSETPSLRRNYNTHTVVV